MGLRMYSFIYLIRYGLTAFPASHLPVRRFNPSWHLTAVGAVSSAIAVHVASRRRFSLPFLATALLFVGIECRADNFAYNDFRAPSLLIFQGDTELVAGRARLTSAERSKAGGMWFSTKQPVKDGFGTSFQFQLTDPGTFGANGLAFVIQNNQTPLLGLDGHGMGFRGIPNSLVIKFDPYHFKNHHYVKYDEVAVLVNGSTNIYPSDAGAIGLTTNAVYTDKQIHAVKIVYAFGNIKVFLDNFENPLLTVPVDLSEAMSLDNGRAWVGFTAATGADFYNQDVISWSFDSSNAIVQNEARTTPLTVPEFQRVNTPQIDSGNTVPTPSTTPLTVDPSFGYTVPGDVGLTHQIEASTDLVHWTPVTNAILYFRDPESTNYNQRFYRFRQK